MPTKPAPDTPVFLPDLCHGYSVLVVVIVAELMAIVLALMSGYYQGFNVSHFALTSFFMQWVGLTSACLLCLSRSWLNRLPSTLSAVLVVLLVSAVTLMFSLLARGVINWVAGVDLLYNLWDYDLVSNVLIAAIITGMIVRYFVVQEALRRQREAELASRLQALQSRIRPHFLFNSMNIIASLIPIEPDTAEQVVDDLSQLFRATLKEGTQPVPLEKELAVCQHYIHIEQLRLGDRLEVEWQQDASLMQQPIPLLTLQPLLENAIYHGIQPLVEGGVVRVSIEHDDEHVVIRITNPVGDKTTNSGNRMALDNIRERLRALHGKAASLDVGNNAGQFHVVIRYPLTTSDDNANTGRR